MPSSTSSSDQVLIDHVPYRSLPDHHWMRAITISMIVLLIALIGWELLARSMHHETGKYLSSLDSGWAKERKKLDQADHNHRVVLLGSSRLLYGADLDILEKDLGSRPLQLSLPGTGPALFIKDVVENTDFDGLIIVGVTPFLFNNPGKGAFGEGALDRYHNESPSQWTGSQIHDFLARHLAFVDDGFSIFGLSKHYIQLPHREGSEKLDAEGWKLGNAYADRQTDLWAPVEVEGSFDNQQHLNFWLNFIGGEPPPPPVVEGMAKESIEYFKPLVEKLRARGGDMFFVRLPSSKTYLEFETKSQYKDLVWKPMLEQLDLPGLHCMDYPELSTDLITPEWSHLTRDSQDKWSSRFGHYLRSYYENSRGVSLKQLIDRAPKQSQQEG